MPAARYAKKASVRSGALPVHALELSFPKIDLPIQPPYAPAEAKAVQEIPRESGWLYEPKWDGFRCVAFRNGHEVVLQSKAGQPLTRYFPEIVAALRALAATKFVLDGEIVVRQRGRGSHGLDFDALLQRIHPAASRVKRLSQETPASYMVFDLLVDKQGKSLAAQPLSARRMKLQRFAERFLIERSQKTGAKKSAKATQSFAAAMPVSASRARVQLSPASSDFATAEKWMREGAGAGWDGVVAKRLDSGYASGERTSMVKIKRIRSADCVVGGFRWARGGDKSRQGKAAAKTADHEVGSLLLGLYNTGGELDHVGFSSSFSREDRKKLRPILEPFIAGPARNGAGEKPGAGGFSGKAPGGPSRWTRDDRDTEWIPLKPRLVGEFQYDHFSGGRFRHGTKFLRWRPEKKPRQCTIEQVKPAQERAA